MIKMKSDLKCTLAHELCVFHINALYLVIQNIIIKRNNDHKTADNICNRFHFLFGVF